MAQALIPKGVCGAKIVSEGGSPGATLTVRSTGLWNFRYLKQPDPARAVRS